MSIWSETSYAIMELSNHIKGPVSKNITHSLLGSSKFVNTYTNFIWDTVNNRPDESPITLIEVSGEGSVDYAFTTYSQSISAVRGLLYRMTIEIDDEVLFQDDGLSFQGYSATTSGFKGILQPKNLVAASNSATSANVYVNDNFVPASHITYTTKTAFNNRRKYILSNLFPYVSSYENAETTMVVPAPLYFKKNFKVTVNPIKAGASYEQASNVTGSRANLYCRLSVNQKEKQ